jgi:hypothetical protein
MYRTLGAHVSGTSGNKTLKKRKKYEIKFLKTVGNQKTRGNFSAAR